MNLTGLPGAPVFRTEMALYGDYSSGTRDPLKAKKPILRPLRGLQRKAGENNVLR